MARIMIFATFLVNWWSLNLMKILHYLFEVKLNPKGHIKGYFEYIFKMVHNSCQNKPKYREIYIKNKELYMY